MTAGSGPAPGEEAGATRTRLLLAVLVAAVATLLLARAAAATGVTWDEPIYLQSARGILSWAALWRGPGGAAAALDDRAMVEHLDGSRWADVHPAFAKLAGAATLALLEGRLGELVAYRMANVLLGALATALVFLVVARRFESAGLGLIVAALCTSLPRVAGDLAVGATDGTLWAVSLPAAIAGYRGARRAAPGWAALAGALCGVAMATRYTGLYLPLGILLWTYLYERARGQHNLFWIPLVAPAVFVLLNPAFWHDPLVRTLDYFARSSARHHSEPHLGYLGDFFVRTPWYYPGALFLATVPPAALLLVVAGTVLVLRDRLRDPLAGLFLILALLPVAIVLVPGAVAYDGVRLFLPTFLFAGLLAAWALDRIRAPLARPAIAALLVVALMLPALLAAPYLLEYYAPQVGGRAGAARLGFEVTYWWDAATAGFLAAANRALPAGAHVGLFPADPPLREYYARHRLLGGEIVAPEASDHLVVLCRPECGNSRLGAFVSRWYPDPEVLLSWPEDEADLRRAYLMVLRRRAR